MISLLRPMYNHLAWANDRVIASLEQPALGDPRPLELFSHIVAAEHVWISRIRAASPKLNTFPKLSLDECRSLSRENLLAFAAILASATDESLEQNVHYATIDGTTYDNPVGAILTHVALHGSYHRGQIAASIRANGATPTPTDYIVFVRAGSPEMMAMELFD